MSQRHRDLAARWVRDYLQDVDPDAEPVGVERTVAFPTGQLAVSGRIDRVDERERELVVVDYKTGRRPLTTDDARSSLAMAPPSTRPASSRPDSGSGITGTPSSAGMPSAATSAANGPALAASRPRTWMLPREVISTMPLP